MAELHVRAVCARNLQDTRTFGTQDPYCKISLRGRTFKTCVHDNGGACGHRLGCGARTDRVRARSSRWQSQTRRRCGTSDPQLDQLHVKVKDKGFTSSSLIGEVYLPVNMFLHGSVVDEWYTLNNEDERAGEINLRIQFVGTVVPPAMYPSPQPPVLVVPQHQAHAVPQQHQYPPPPPQQQVYAQPPPLQQVYPSQQGYQPAQGYGYPPPPAAYGALPPAVVYSAPAMVYASGHHGHHGYHGGGDGGGGDAAEIALGVGAGILGGMAVEDVFFD